MSGAGGRVTTVGAVTSEAANASLTFAAGTGDAGAFTQTAGPANTIRTGTGALTITADSIALNTTPDSITSTGAITLQPATAARPIVIGAAGAATDFALARSRGRGADGRRDEYHDWSERRHRWRHDQRDHLQ